MPKCRRINGKGEEREKEQEREKERERKSIDFFGALIRIIKQILIS